MYTNREGKSIILNKNIFIKIFRKIKKTNFMKVFQGMWRITVLVVPK
ncbi:hypothetical protein KKC1_19950 [Calderihabitans maritimus]|uniref:Uncharacterized protein n=1 Tax=Calderihabitans maritimus TaxID=1246530 RepID=A0A1Z5HU28_9FIRM|nr:hypothetical protein KKC1_19950 [Calderihabitans maritimus]